VLLGCVLIVPLLYFPYLLHNLPVAGNVDEQTSLAILLRFHGSLNPQFFMYPTLYYYLTYFLVAPLFSAHFLLAGRALNLCLVGVTAFLSYAFCKRHLDSAAAGLISALCVITSTTITNSGSYLCTDVLLAAATLASLHYLAAYFAGCDLRFWLLGMVLLGAAVGSKYTAFLLFIAYYLAELILSIRRAKSGSEDEKFPRTAVLCFLLASGLLALCAASFFPVQAVLHFVASNRSNANLRDPAEYLVFFQHLRNALAELGVLCLAVALVVRLSRLAYLSLARKRPYYGLLIVLLISYLSTPYSLIDPKRFLYDLGALARSNIVVAGHHAEWGQYLSWLFSNENAILIVLSAVGLILISARARLHLFIVGLYLVLYSLVIGSAHLGYPRYLTPVLPLLYCAAGVTLVRLWKWKPFAASFPLTKVAAVILTLIVAIQLGIRIARDRALSRNSDALLASYQIARLNTAGTDLYAGYTPSVELEAAGINTRQVSWAALSTGPLGSQMGCGDLLILDKKEAKLHSIDATGDSTVTILLDDSSSNGQEVVRRKGCQ
jgi:4-amino-4-deoxy-L-arabinose transferase-like glycosyltransferase